VARTTKRTKHVKQRLVLIVLLLVACLAVAAVGLLDTHHARQVNQALHTATSHQPERFTELYFTNYSALPKVITADNVYSAPFTVTDHEAQSATYTYQAETIESGTTYPQAPVKFSLRNNQSVSQIVHFSALHPGDQVELVIRLLNKNLIIHYRAQS